MTTVVFFGNSNKKISNEICMALSSHKIAKVMTNNIYIEDKNVDFLIVELYSKATINADQGIIVVTGKINDNAKLSISGNFKGVVFSSDKAALRLLKKANITAITCGMAEQDTLSLSSIKKNSAIVCINRKIETLSGNIIEPQEHKINIKSPITDYALLAASAILLYCDIEPEDIFC